MNDVTSELRLQKGVLDTDLGSARCWRANKYIVDNRASQSAAKDPAKLRQTGRADSIANLLEEGSRVVADTLEPFMPVTARKIFDLLNVDEAAARKPYGEGLKPGHRVKPPVPLFPRREKLAAS